MNLQFEQPFENSTTARRSKPVITQEVVGSPPYIAAEQFSFDDVVVNARTVRPGDTVTVTAFYSSKATGLVTQFDFNQDHVDACSPGGFTSGPGADLYVEAELATADASPGSCWDTFNRGQIDETLEVAAPTREGTAPLEVRLVGGNSRQVYESETIEIQVSGQASPPPDRPEDDPDDTQPGDTPEDEECGFVEGLLGQCEGQDGLLSGIEGPLIALVVILLLLFAISASI
jgi:hypothetical protein